ncbi:hypothetical protein T08_12509 [Trichinella sp. T8]|nr:hypothetical protein T08_12509 [Trichinella sp. T8]
MIFYGCYDWMSTSIIDRFTISKLKDHSIWMSSAVYYSVICYDLDHCLQIITTDNYGKHYGVEN